MKEGPRGEFPLISVWFRQKGKKKKERSGESETRVNTKQTRTEETNFVCIAGNSSSNTALVLADAAPSSSSLAFSSTLRDSGIQTSLGDGLFCFPCD